MGESAGEIEIVNEREREWNSLETDIHQGREAERKKARMRERQ